MTSGEFEKLVERYRTGACTPEEVAFIAQWMKLNADDESFELEADLDSVSIGDEMWEKIRENAGLEPKYTTARVRWYAIGIAAASVALLVVGALFSNFFLVGQSDRVITGLETFNRSETNQRILLPDSSVVTLAEGAKIVVSENYGEQNRSVRLTGEAFFEIKANPQKPFLVYSGDLITEVLGTSFQVKPVRNRKSIEVSVVTGKVSVYIGEKDRKQRRSGVIINPNQKVVFNTESKSITQDIVDNPKIILENQKEISFLFDETPLKTVLTQLQGAYGMDIVVNNSAINNCSFTGNLNGFALFKQLDYICDVIEAQYEVRGTTIFLTGRGCNAN